MANHYRRVLGKRRPKQLVDYRSTGKRGLDDH